MYGCTDIYEMEKYNRPSWLAGKLYTQVAAEEDLTRFAECLRLTGYDTILDVSGSFTVFAPSDEAMDHFLATNQYSSVSEIPGEELKKIVKFHIIQNPWSLLQLQSLNLDGWVDPFDENSRPNAYKRQTLLKNPDEKYWVKYNNGKNIIVTDSLKANDYRRVFTESRKYVPIFFDDFFEIYGLAPEDYTFYFDRPYEPGNVYYAEAKVTRPEIFAENGFIHVVDRVVKPMLNAMEMLERDLPGESYKFFFDLVCQYPVFRKNKEETNKQAGARFGRPYDTLYNLSFPELAFDLHEEITVPRGFPAELYYFTYVLHNGMFIPTDNAFQVFLDEVFTNKSGYPHWPDFESAPKPIIRLIVNSHFTNQPVYPDDDGGFHDGQGNRVSLDESDIIRKEFGSNCTFLGIDKYIVPRVFTGVTGPVYLRPEFSTFMYAMELTGLGNELAGRSREHSFFPVPDQVLANDSSLLIEWVDRESNEYTFKCFNRSTEMLINVSHRTLKQRIENQIGYSLPNGSANKEFIRTMDGNFIIWNNSNNTVQGTAPNTFGYNGSVPVSYLPELLEEPSDNGKTWRVGSWFRNVSSSMYTTLIRYPEFMDLLEKAGLYDPLLYEFPFLERWGTYTIFIPSAQALSVYRADTLTRDELSDFLLYHFVNNRMIFTDNKGGWYDYETLREDETSTPFTTRYSTVNIRPGRDLIEILDSTENPYVSIPEAEGTTNIMISYYDWITSVAHEIDTVLIKQ